VEIFSNSENAAIFTAVNNMQIVTKHANIFLFIKYHTSLLDYNYSLIIINKVSFIPGPPKLAVPLVVSLHVQQKTLLEAPRSIAPTILLIPLLKIVLVLGSYSYIIFFTSEAKFIDAAEAFGMRWKDKEGQYRHAGTIGDYGIFSFFPTKTLGGYGDGGMIVTNSENLANLAKSYRVHGAAKKYHYDYIGYNSRLDTLQAAVLSVKLKHIDKSIKKRAEIAKLYKERLIDCESIRLPIVKGDQEQVYYVFNILVENRDQLAEHLKKNEIGYSIYYPMPLHQQKCFEYLGYKKGDFPVAEKVSEKIIALPIYPEITVDEIDYVCDTIKKFYK
jgi:hypothetical protein